MTARLPLRLLLALLFAAACCMTGAFASHGAENSELLGFDAAEGTPNLNNTVNAVEDFLGGQGKIIKNADGDTILMRGDKKIRFDIKDPHGDKPHFHLEQQTPSGKWKDAGPEHRYYFKEDGQ